GGHAERAEAVARYVAEVGAPAVLIAHGAGAATALAAAERVAVPGVVVVAPLVPGSRGARTLTLGLRSALPLLLGRPVPPPSGHREDLLLGELPEPMRRRVRAGLGPESAAAVWEAARGVPAGLASGVPVLVVSGSRDPLLPADDAATLAG